MSTLWKVEVREVSGRRTALRVGLAHPDAGDFSDSRAFALRLLYDGVWTYRLKVGRIALGPLGDAVDADRITDQSWVEAHADRFIVSVEVGGIEGPPFDEGSARQRVDAAVRRRGLAPREGEAWKSAWAEEWRAFWQEPSNLPAAPYVIEVTHERWLSHLEPGRRWESSAFDEAP